MNSAGLRRPSAADVLAWVLAGMLLGMASATWAQVTVQLTDPDNGTVYAQAPVNIVLWASTSSSQGYTVSKVEFFLGSTLIGTGSSGSSPSHFAWFNVQSGSYSVTAKATAVKKNSPNVTATSSPVNITVNAHPVVTLTSPAASGTEYSIPPPTVTVSATATDSDGTIAKVEFYSCFETGELITTITTPPYTFQWTLPIPYWQPGYFRLYGIRAEVVDNLGARGVSKCPLITVAPTVTLTSPVDGGTYATPATIALNAAVNPVDGPVKVKFYNGNALIGEDLTAPFSFSWENVGAGTYALTAVVAESEGWREWSSAPVNVTVTAVSAQSKLHFIHVDHLNTPRLVADATGTTVWLWHQAEPFGNDVADENTSGLGIFDLPLRIPGQYFDKETNLHYNYFRDYDPSIGRYAESDPIGLVGGLNTYVYVRSTPITNVDLLGLLGSRGNQTYGCGSGANQPWVPNHPLGFPFLDCCNEHDRCYDDCVNKPSRAQCDTNFCSCIASKCHRYARGQKRQCESWSRTYCDMVTQHGEGAFNKARSRCPAC